MEKETRKSEPIYKDLSSSLTVERAKYLGLERVDAKSIALSLIQKAKHYDSGSRLAEFNLNRAALARGGEHSYARYDEGAFDPYFQAPDFDWSIIKQKERQCMLVFCDLNLYMVCPFFSFAVFFLFGGLRRDTVSDLKKPFIFPHLRSIRSDSVANRMTKTLQNNIEFPDRKPAFTSRSMRKGSMTENRLHRDLSPDEEVARSGHTPGGGGPPKNSNAEGYVASTPGMNAPGGLALAGYTNCHMQPVPFNFDCLGMEAYETVQRLVGALFVNDVPELKKGGKLHAVLNICAARLIGSLVDLVADVGYNHPIVQKIISAAQEAKVVDDRVEAPIGAANLPRHYIVLKDWSKKIKHAFVENNPQHAPASGNTEAKVAGMESLVASILPRLTSLEEAVTARESNNEVLQIQRDEIQRLNAEIEVLRQTNLMQKRMLKAVSSPDHNVSYAQAKSPCPSMPAIMPAISHNTSAAGEGDASATGENSSTTGEYINTPVADTESERCAQPPTKKQKTTTAQKTTVTTASAAYSTVVDNAMKSPAPAKIGDHTVQLELERLVENGVISKRQKAYRGDGFVSKSILFDEKNYLFVGLPDQFALISEGARYRRGMTTVAMVITQQQWEELCNLESTELDEDRRKFLVRIQDATMVRILELEVQAGLKEAGKKSRARPTIHSIAGRLLDVTKKWKEQGMADLDVENKIHLYAIGFRKGQQTLSFARQG